MARDSQTKLSKREQIKRSKKQEEINKKRKQVENSDSDDNDGSESESDEIDVHEYRKLISQIFPSKHMNNKVLAGEKLKKVERRNKKRKEGETPFFLISKKI